MTDNVPASPSVHIAVPIVLTAMEGRQKAIRGQIMILLGAGIPLSFLGPLVLGTLFYFANNVLSWGYHGWPHIWWIFFVLLFSAILLPLLYQREKYNVTPEAELIRTDNEGKQITSVSQTATDLTSMGFLGMQLGDMDDIPADKWFVRPLLLGPKMVVRAWPQKELLDHLSRAVDKLTAANILIQLSGRARGALVTDLTTGIDSDPARLQTALIYLRQLSWLDANEDVSRVWLTAEAKEGLAGIIMDDLRTQ